MDSDSIAKINLAVDACLERCTSTADLDMVLREYLKELFDTGWTPLDVATVENAVKRALEFPH